MHARVKLKVLRLSDNMRNVAVTEGDKVEAEIKFGWSVNHWAIGDLVSRMDEVTDEQIDAQMDSYAKDYEIATEDTDAVRYQAKISSPAKYVRGRQFWGIYYKF